MPSLPKWFGGRNSYQDQSGEYYPSNGYTFKYTMFRADTKDWHVGNAPYLIAELRYDRRKWCVRAVVEGLEVARVAGDASNLKLAKLESWDVIMGWDVPYLMSRYYAENNANLILLNEEPFVTLFGPYPDYYLLPNDDTYITENRKVIRHGCGYTSQLI